MQVAVIDCSFILSLVLPDENSEFFDLTRYSVYVPPIFFLENMNVLKTALYKKRLTKAQFEEYVWVLKDLPFQVDHFTSTAESLHTIARLALEHDLTSYDTSYLELAIRLGACLGTHDKKLKEACKKLEISTL